MSVSTMEHLTPAELLRFLEEEAKTLQSLNAKIANQLHCLQVEEELLSRQLSNSGNETARQSIDRHVEEDFDDFEASLQNESQSGQLVLHSTASAGRTDQANVSSPKLLESSERRDSPEAVEHRETVEIGIDQHVEKDLQGQRQQQNPVEVKEPTAPDRAAGRRTSRRPARFLD